MTRGALLPLALCVLLSGCAKDPTHLDVEPGGVSMFAFTGTVRHQDIEGGFYGIVADDSTKYDVGEIPARFQKDGLRVNFSVRPTNNGMTTRQWGKHVELTSISELPPPPKKK